MPANTISDPSAAKTDLQGLELAEHHFGPLLRPTLVSVPRKGSEEDSKEDEYDEYSDDAWLFNSVKACVSQIEDEMDFEDGTLQKCITILCNDTVLDDEKPRSTNHIVRIYSPTAPMYIDVHFKYYCRSHRSEVDWQYTLGYKIQRRPSATASNALAIKNELKMGGPPDVYTCNGWQTLGWGCYDDYYRNYGEHGPHVEFGRVELREEGVMDVHEALFGELEKPAETDSEAMLAYHRSLVRGIRLLLAAVGISYDLMLEGLSDKWVARGIRNACGLRLARDAGEERKGAIERQEAKGYDDDSEDDDEGDYDSGYGF
ncbi:hypothetical protein DFJ58DRAFT_812761 [Suillus subalutaceus]|uniref:uncharacterized protein n=1 Tax=Suillus subalutaceus TaxID=48586 RepID=UPI001B8794B5|nr:uncharacterized protein DFJ58DRAFT_812761 [Suillus subalutaceus]KAG1839339.1 hypothetical protein DFJ58DRAFT_812761 [Suillus subalutaceus]